jgi:hypothetical protein
MRKKSGVCRGQTYKKWESPEGKLYTTKGQAMAAGFKPMFS